MACRPLGEPGKQMMDGNDSVATVRVGMGPTCQAAAEEQVLPCFKCIPQRPQGWGLVLKAFVRRVKAGDIPNRKGLVCSTDARASLSRWV